LIIDELRSRTQPSHLELDRAVYPIIQQVRTIEAYDKLLSVFYGYFKPVYDQFLPFDLPPAFSGNDERRKPEWILGDRKQLGMETNDLALCDDIPPLTSKAAALGAYYVLEGSTMGGAIISKKIKENLGFTNDNGTCFFNGYGEHNKKMWNDFLSLLNEENLTDVTREELIDSAQKTFLKFKDWIIKHYG
jgi:heme oxygenase